MSVLLFDVFNESSSSIKEINRWIRKGMSNIYYWEKLMFSKLSFSRKENLKKCNNFEEKKGTKYIRGTFILALTSSAFFCLHNLKLFCLGDKRLLSEFLWKWGWFQGQWMFPWTSWLKIRISKNWGMVL